MSFVSWLLRVTLVLSFVLSTAANAGALFSMPSAAIASDAGQAHCVDEQAPDHQTHHASEVDSDSSGAQHDLASGCCQVGNCHCPGSHCASCVAGPMASALSVLRHTAVPFSLSVYGSPALPLSIRPPIA